MTFPPVDLKTLPEYYRNDNPVTSPEDAQAIRESILEKYGQNFFEERSEDAEQLFS